MNQERETSPGRERLGAERQKEILRHGNKRPRMTLPRRPNGAGGWGGLMVRPRGSWGAEE